MSTEPDYMTTYRKDWQDIVEPDGVLNRDQIARELSDYSVVMEEASKVYEELANLSKPNSAAVHVIAIAEEKFASLYAEFLLHDLLPYIEGDENRQHVIDTANNWSAGSYDEHVAEEERRKAS